MDSSANGTTSSSPCTDMIIHLPNVMRVQIRVMDNTIFTLGIFLAFITVSRSEEGSAKLLVLLRTPDQSMLYANSNTTEMPSRNVQLRFVVLRGKTFLLTSNYSVQTSMSFQVEHESY